MEKLLLLGYGKMAKALCEGLKNQYQIFVSGRNSQKIQDFCDTLQVKPLFYKDSLNLNDYEVLLCIKPHALKNFHFVGKAKCVYSVLNGISLATLKESISSKAYIRAMPNVAASIKASLTSLCGDESQKQAAFDIFSSIGECIWVEESIMPIATALGSCSPAFLALISEALIDSGVANGLTREQSTLIVKGLFNGFSRLLCDKHPTQIKETVMSPGGSTAKGIESLEKNALRGSLFEAILASKNQA